MICRTPIVQAGVRRTGTEAKMRPKAIASAPVAATDATMVFWQRPQIDLSQSPLKRPKAAGSVRS